MFGRRNHKTRMQKLGEFFWPAMGWSRTYHYYRHRISRLSGTADAIACGLASGAAASFTPFLGFHIIIGVIITWTMRGNLIAAALGTIAGNPWTFPIIWVATYKLGNLLLGFSRNGSEHMPSDISLSTLWEHPMDLLVPMTIGGVILAFFVWFIVFYIMRGTIHRYQRRRARRRRRRMIRRKLDMRRKKRKAARKAMEAAAREISREISE